MDTNIVCHNTTFVYGTETNSHIEPVLEKKQAVLLMVLGFGGLSTTVAILHRLIRKYVYKDSHDLDTVFDAGGKVSFGMTAVTMTSQLLWPADFLQQATLMAKTGLGGSLFYNIAIVISILVFPLLSYTLKSRAPGAKTFLQIVHTRYGQTAHILFCIIALLTNCMILMALILAAKTAVDVLVKGVSDELMLFILAFLFGSYCIIGGLGTTFYISYFTTALTFICSLVFVITTRYKDPDSTATSEQRLYEAMSCLKTSDGNSYLTFWSHDGLIYGILMLLLTVSLSVCDQANWQSRVAAKPTEGVVGFFIAAYLFFAIPLTTTTTATSIYLSGLYQNGSSGLTSKEIDSGYITPYVMQGIMGDSGAFLLITILTMTLMATGSGEIMAISSIFVYDIYKVYICPFRKDVLTTDCPLCGKDRLSNDLGEQCLCPAATSCQDCAIDVKKRELLPEHQVRYECSTHGKYRHYEDQLLQKKNWCMLWVTISIVPYGLMIIHSGVDLNWVMFTLIGSLSSFLWPIVLTIVWAKCTALGVVAGSIGGVLSYYTGLFVVAEVVYEDGLQNFLVNTSKEYSLLGGIVSGLVVSLTLVITISLFVNNIETKQDASSVWASTMAIDNPLSPWRKKYKKELQKIKVFDEVRITLKQFKNIFKRTWLLAIIGGLFSLFLFGFILPASVMSFGNLSFDQYAGWITFCQTWLIISAAFAIFVPPIEEIIQIIKEYNRQSEKKMGSQTDINCADESNNPLKTS